MSDSHLYAACIRVGRWTPEHQRNADDAGIELFREWDDGEATVEVYAPSEHHANATIYRALGVSWRDFLVPSALCG